MKKNILKIGWIYLYFLLEFFIILSALFQKFIFKNNLNLWDSNLTIIGLANWIPFILLFHAFRPYSKSNEQRKNIIKFLVSSTFPILISGFMQYFLNWTGPLSTLNGLIIWYQRPIVFPGGLSSVFSHQNYAGSWLNLIWPLCIALVLINRKIY